LGDESDQLAVILKALRGSADIVPVGFYRAQTDPQLRLNAEDLRIAREHFPHHADVFLLIHLSNLGDDNATFFFWDQDHIYDDVAFLEFPFDPSLLAALENRHLQGIESRPVLAAPTAAPQLPVTETSALPALPPEVRQRRRAVVLLAGLVMVLLVAGALYWRPFSLTTARVSSPQTATSRPPLGLKVQRQGGDLVLTWDREAAGRLGATAGLLSIRDGKIEKEIGLNAEQLRSANVLLSPESDQVQIQMTFLLPDQRTISESGFAILPKRGSADQTVVTRAVAPHPVSATQVEARVPKVVPQREFTPPAGPAAGAGPVTEPPPVLSGTDLNTRSLPISSLLSQPLPAPPVSGTNPGRPAEPAPPAAAPSPSQAIAPAAPRVVPESSASPGDARPAKLLSGEGPAYPQLARQLRVQGTVVVDVLVGTDGKVKQLKVVSGHPMLRDAAVAAVRRWIYSPALLNGEPVEASTLVGVIFRANW
jgi:protein TonB